MEVNGENSKCKKKNAMGELLFFFHSSTKELIKVNQ